MESWFVTRRSFKNVVKPFFAVIKAENKPFKTSSGITIPVLIIFAGPFAKKS